MFDDEKVKCCSGRKWKTQKLCIILKAQLQFKIVCPLIIFIINKYIITAH